jgi:hypothetical protein
MPLNVVNSVRVANAFHVPKSNRLYIKRFITYFYPLLPAREYNRICARMPVNKTKSLVNPYDLNIMD